MHPATETRRGFTLVELLVVIAIIGTLVGLLLPAVQRVRESSRRSTCANNIRQIALGMHSHHDARGTFPFGQVRPLQRFVFTDGTISASGVISGKTQAIDARTWMVTICPYIEMSNVYDQCMTAVSLNTSALYTLSVAQMRHPLFMCPTDFSRTNLVRGFCGNYVASASSTAFGVAGEGNSLNGVSFAMSAVNISQVTDGLSKTTMLAECVRGAETNFHGHGQYFNCWVGESLFSTQYTPNTTVSDVSNYIDDYRPWAPTIGGSTFAAYARSMHADGVNVAMADGAVRFVTNSVDAAVWTAAGSRNGSESLGALE